VNSSALAEWALFGFGVVVTLLGVVAAKQVPKLFKGKSIQNVVDSANAIIEMYEKHVSALELKVDSLEKEVSALTAKLDETLKANNVLQRMLAASPAINLPEVK
jgi:peptidoglycan hydrolase CwlO-like protein